MRPDPVSGMIGTEEGPDIITMTLYSHYFSMGGPPNPSYSRREALKPPNPKPLRIALTLKLYTLNPETPAP